MSYKTKTEQQFLKRTSYHHHQHCRCYNMAL